MSKSSYCPVGRKETQNKINIYKGNENINVSNPTGIDVLISWILIKDLKIMRG